MCKNIPYKKYAVACLLSLGTGLSRVLEGCVWVGEKLYRLLRYHLKTLWIAAVTAIVLIPFGVYPLRGTSRKSYLKWGGIIIASGLGCLLLLVLLIYFGAFGKLSTKQELKELRQVEANLVYDDNNVCIDKFFILDRTRIEYKDFPPYLINVLIATEDERFYDHNGIDTKSLFRVFFKTLLLQDDSSGGGSTLTVQLARNLLEREEHYDKLTMPTHKIKGMVIARRIKGVYTKEEIITLYLNTVPFSDSTYGIESASYRFFNKPAKELTLNEAAALIGILKANNNYNPRLYPQHSEERRNTASAKIKGNGYLIDEDLAAQTKDSLKIDYNTIISEGVAPYLREQIRLQLPELLKNITKEDGTPYNIYRGEFRIYTTIDYTMQEYAEAAVKKHLARLQKKFEQVYGKKVPRSSDSGWFKQEVRRLPICKELKAKNLTEEETWKQLGEKKNMELSFYEEDKVQQHSTFDNLSHYIRLLNTGSASVNPQTGVIKTYVGGVDFEYFKYDYVLQSKRQVGLIFKPIVYAIALEMGMPACSHFSPCALIYADKKYWTPRNSSVTDDDPSTYYSVGKALKEPLNTIAIQTLFYAGLQNVIQKAYKMGTKTPLPQVLSIALGSVELSVMEMAKTFTTFANKGVPSQSYFIEKIVGKKGEVIWQHKPTKQEAAISEATAQKMIQLIHATINEGIAARMRGQYGLTGDLAGKTDTTQDNKDGWFAGVLPNLVMISWVGNDHQIGFRSTRIGRGADSALPIAALFIQQLSRNRQLNSFTKATFETSDEVRGEVLECESIVREGFIDRLLNVPPKDTIYAGDIHYRLYECKGKLHGIDNDDDKVSIDDVMDPNTQSATQQKEEPEKRKSFFNRIFR